VLGLGVKFRHQVILGATIVDFFAPEPRLVVEVDGTSHVGLEWRDRQRDAYFARHGVRVLRVTA
jgi:very-short-patch-repair endonuclease